MTMRSLELSEATSPLADYVRLSRNDTTVITDQGVPVAVIVSVENADLETISLSGNPRFMALIEQSRIRQEREGGIPADEMRRGLGLFVDVTAES